MISNPVRPDEWVLFEGLKPCRMLELGNKVNSRSGISYKRFFESLGYDHTSIDWNGLDGALKLDLQTPIDLEPFDVITNIGTTEHVKEQFGVWANIHNLLKVDGVLISVTPKADGKNWKRHGFWYPKHEFFNEFARLNGYEVLELYDNKHPPTSNTYVKLRKVKSLDFTLPEMTTFYKNQ